MTRRFWRREFFRPLDNKKGFSHPHLNFFTASPVGEEGWGEGEISNIFGWDFSKVVGGLKNPEEPSRLTHQTLSIGEAELNIPFFSHDESDGEGQAFVDFA
jgi:hypothetical protein